MLTIDNIHKIVGRKIPIQAQGWICRVRDVYYMSDNTYVFEVETNSTDYLNQKKIQIILDRKPPRGVYTLEKHWELSWEMYNRSNCYETQLVSSRVIRDMNLFGIALGDFVDMIIRS
jgi:DNA topoisomerase VI subunit A